MTKYRNTARCAGKERSSVVCCFSSGEALPVLRAVKLSGSQCRAVLIQNCACTEDVRGELHRDVSCTIG